MCLTCRPALRKNAAAATEGYGSVLKAAFALPPLVAWAPDTDLINIFNGIPDGLSKPEDRCVFVCVYVCVCLCVCVPCSGLHCRGGFFAIGQARATTMAHTVFHSC